MAVRNRVVYADARGALQVLWKGDENVPYLWKGSVPVRKRKKGSLPDRPGRLLPDGFGGQPDFRGPDGPPSTPEEMQERMRERGSN
jgi:hypothetical protein